MTAFMFSISLPSAFEGALILYVVFMVFAINRVKDVGRTEPHE